MSRLRCCLLLFASLLYYNAHAQKTSHYTMLRLDSVRQAEIGFEKNVKFFLFNDSTQELSIIFDNDAAHHKYKLADTYGGVHYYEPANADEKLKKYGVYVGRLNGQFVGRFVKSGTASEIMDYSLGNCNMTFLTVWCCKNHAKKHCCSDWASMKDHTDKDKCLF